MSAKLSQKQIRKIRKEARVGAAARIENNIEKMLFSKTKLATFIKQHGKDIEKGMLYNTPIRRKEHKLKK